MIRLYTGSGSWEIQILGPHFSDEEWLRTRESIVKLLTSRKRPGVGLLDKLPWNLQDATNFFGDEFCVLYARVPINTYIEAAEYEHNEAAKTAAKAIADTFQELGIYVRFVAFEPDLESTPARVAAPAIKTNAAATSRALNDAEQLLQTNGAISAVDRVHTALHGYLRELCNEAEIQVGLTDTMTGLWKRLKSEHPRLSETATHNQHVIRIVSGVATILDALNPIRNNASVAHANEELLTEPEAMLAVNAGRTILHYLEATLRG
jgi:hypothetical protein